MYLDRTRTDGEYFSSLKEWEAAVRVRYPEARFEVEEHPTYKRLYVHRGDDPTGADQIGNFTHNVDTDDGHGFIVNPGNV